MQTGQQARQPRPNRAFWPGADRGDILDQISNALIRAGAVVVLTGGAAMGKTRLAFEATARVEAAAIPCRTVAGDRHADLNAIIDEMARLPQPRSTDAKARALLVVDQAERAGAQTLEQLILIAEQTAIAVMLIGRAELASILVRSVPERICDAITHCVTLEPLNAVQTAEFLMHLLGEETTPATCGEDAIRRIVVHSHGVPGVIDRMMTDALRLARLSRSARLTATVIDMIADDEHPPDEQRHSRREPSAEPPVQAFQRQVKPVAAPQPTPQQPAPQQPAIVARSMRIIITDLHERPDTASGSDGGEDSDRYGDQYGDQDDLTTPEWPKPSAKLRRLARRVPPWAGGIAFVVVATSVIALQHYLQSDAPVLELTDRSRAVVSSVVGDTIMRPTAASSEPAPAPTPAPTPPPADPVSSVAEPAPITADTPTVQIAYVESPMLRPPMIDGEAKPGDVQEAVPEGTPEPPVVLAFPLTSVPPENPIAEPTAEKAPDAEPSPLEPAATARPEPETSEPANEAIAPAEPEIIPELPPSPEPTAQIPLEPEPPAPSVEALSPIGPEAAPMEPSLLEPTVEGPAEQAPADTATELASPDTTEPPVLEMPPPESPAAEMSPPIEPAPPESPAAVAVPEPAPQEPAPGQASPPEPEPEPTIAEPFPPPEPFTEPPAPEPVPEPAIVTAAPPPPPPTPAPAAPKPPTVAESVLLEKGDRLLAIGDIASARLLYETAAAGGSARGALLAGMTHDPAYLRSLGARGVTGDPTRAAAWYEKAAKLGDDSATAHLEALGRR
jgi:hypothetical protein